MYSAWLKDVIFPGCSSLTFDTSTVKIGPCALTLEMVSSLNMKSTRLVIPLHSLYWSIHTKDESERGTAFTFIFDVN